MTNWQPALSPALRHLLKGVFALFGLLSVNSLYLVSVTLTEWWTGQITQDYLYLLMFLAHLALGLLILAPPLLFGFLHLRRTWSRTNRRAVHYGLSLYSVIILLLTSGIMLMEIGPLEMRNPVVRNFTYWLHISTPPAAVALFLLHRIAGRRVCWKMGVRWGLAMVVVSSLLIASQHWRLRTDTQPLSFSPSLAKLSGGQLIPAAALMMDDYCAECHADAHRQWSQSAHRMSSFNNPAYLFSVRETREYSMRHLGNGSATRFCAGCHDLAPLFSGALDQEDFDDQKDPSAFAGITCVGCHAISSIDSPRGNGDYTLAEPTHYPFVTSKIPALQWTNRQLIKAKPGFHKKSFLKPLHLEPDFCGSCHKVHLPAAINRYKWLRGQNHFDSYTLSGVSGHGASSFYYPDQAVEKCATCHMPLTPSGDFGRNHFGSDNQLTIHDHSFAAANTALPFLLGSGQEATQRHKKFLAKALRADIFAIKEGGTIDGELHAPLRPLLPTLYPGKSYLLEVVVRTTGVGHQFTQGTADSNQVWVEVTATSDGVPFAGSGAMDDEGVVNPWSHFLNAYLLDRSGERIDRRNGQDIFATLYNHQIPPGAADVVHYAFTVPAEAASQVTIDVAVNYRKFDTTYLRHFTGDPLAANELPVTQLARDSVTFSVATAEPTTAPTPLIPQWMRWNDYGIGLLRKPQHGELRQAEQAFAMVETLGHVDGALNLARIYLREGRLQETEDALNRAARFDEIPYPWINTLLTSRLNRQRGFLEQAAAGYRRILNTEYKTAKERNFDFSLDFRVNNELGQTLVELAKSARGESGRLLRQRSLEEAEATFNKTLDRDPENAAAFYNLWLVHAMNGSREAAEQARAQHQKYRRNDNEGDRVILHHRRDNPAADHAAESVVIYTLMPKMQSYGKEPSYSVPDAQLLPSS